MSGAKTEHLSDEMRAGSDFQICKDDLCLLVNEYKSRKYDEDIKVAEGLGAAEGLMQKLKVDQKTGLNGTDFPQRTAAFGNNEREDMQAKTFCAIFCEALDDFMMKVLLVAATASLFFGYVAAKPEDYGHVWIDSVAIYMAVFVVSGVGSIVDWLKEKEFTKRSNEENANYKLPIIRDGQEQNIHVNHIHVGDIVILKVGTVVPIDGLVVKSEQLTLTEAAMTGESDPCKKETTEDCVERRIELEAEKQNSKQGAHEKANPHALPSPVILSGTEVVAGKGLMVVTMVGDSSAIGEIMAKLKNKTGQTPLQKKLTVIAENVGLLGTYFALLTVHVLFVRYFIDGVNKRQIILFDEVDDRLTFWTELLQWVEFFTIGVAVVVVAIPEGLPLAVMLSLAYSQRMMLKDNNNVKKLQACEIMGGATNICSDKTGTLTLNQMKVTRVWLGKDIEIPADQDEVTKKMLPIKPADFFPETLWKTLEMAIVTNVPPQDDYSATDKGMADLLERAGTDIKGMQDKFMKDSIRFHFTSKRKRMSTIVAGAGEGGKKRLFIKGASEMVKNCCASYLDSEGVVQPMNDQINSELDSQIYNYADQALRTIAVAYRDVEENEGGPKHDSPVDEEVKDIEKSGLILIGILGIMDVIRSEVPRSVAQCVEAGVTVRMVTGDNIVTARAIAKLCNILSPQEANDDACCIEGPEFYEQMGGIICAKTKKSASEFSGEGDDKMLLENERIKNMNKFKAIAPKLKVMARSRPEDKYLLVTGLRNLNEVVAVTGDGTNDAPALSKADVGFGMGITGTQVCKAAADIIIIDDSFTSVVKACSWGRNVFDNIQRFLQFQLTVNVNALITVFICSALMKGTPLQAIQLLWVNLIMDSLAALALATEAPKPHLLQRPPQKSDDYIVSRKMTKHITYMAIYQFILIFVIVFYGEWFIPEDMPEHEFAENPGYVSPGREFDINGEPLWFAKRQVNGNEYSRHITFVFHFFVLMQVWNMVACRKIHDEFNILEGIITNWTFVLIWLLILALQFIIIETGSVAFRLSPDGLSMTQQIYACVIALSVFPINAILKCVPDRFGPKLGEDSVFERNEKKRLGQ